MHIVFEAKIVFQVSKESFQYFQAVLVARQRLVRLATHSNSLKDSDVRGVIVDASC